MCEEKSPGEVKDACGQEGDTNTATVYTLLRDLLVQRLEQCGWMDEVRVMARRIVRSHGGNHISASQLLDELAPLGREMVPDAVKREMCVLASQALYPRHDTDTV